MLRISVVVEAALLVALTVLGFVGSRTKIFIFGYDTPMFILLMVLVGVFVFPLRKAEPRPLAQRTFRLFAVVLLYAALTVAVQDHSDTHAQIYAFPLLAACLAMVIPYAMTGLIDSIKTDPRASIFRVSLVITISVSYFAIYKPAYALAGRLATPLGGSADVHVALLLTLAAYFACARSGYLRVPSLALAALTVMLIILTGSRAGFATAALLTVLMSFDTRRIGRSIVVLAGFAGLFVVLLDRFPNDRLSRTTDLARQENLDTALRYLSESSFGHILLGAGSGQIWPWYGYEEGFLGFSQDGLVSTDYGVVLANPHSVVLGTLIELGLFGFVLTVLMLFSIFRRFRKVRDDEDGEFVFILLLGILCTLPAFVFNYYLFKGFPVAFIWWYFVFFALTLAGDVIRQAKEGSAESSRPEPSAMTGPPSPIPLTRYR